MMREKKSDFEVPPHTRVRVVATIEKKLCGEMELIHEQETKQARDEDPVEPDWSNTIEVLLRKGLRAYVKGGSGTCSPWHRHYWFLIIPVVSVSHS